MSLVWRILIVAIMGVVLLQLVAVALFVADRRGDRSDLLPIAGRQIVAVTKLYERAAPSERRLVLAASSNPLFRARPSVDLAFLARHGWEPVSGRAEARVRAALGSLAGREIAVSSHDDWRPRHHSRSWRDGPDDDDDASVVRWHGDDDEAGRRSDWRRDPAPSLRRLAISVPLETGGYLTFLVASDTTSVRWIVRSALLWGLTLVVVLGAILWASRRVARPFQRFAAAADRLGIDVDAPPMSVSGSGELRQATRAFNRMQERVRRMVDDRTMMLAAISHDLRTMLTRLRLRAELIDDAAQRGKAIADLDEMQAMLTGTLDYARGQADREPVQSLDLARLLQAVVDDANDANEGRAQVVYTGPEREVVIGRAVALRRLVQNLLDNALRYGDGSDVELQLSSAADGAELRVLDRGPGIPEAERERVLEPFYRLERSRSRDTGGAGLGLAIARSIARTHGGDLGLADRPGGGLQVVVSLPRG
ncbi:MAG: ATP-binding protein [Pseudomonadota bacterium]